jgi:hypothetical protein
MNKSGLLGAATALALAACANMGVDGSGVASATVLDDICATAEVRCIDVVIQGGAITQVTDEKFIGANHLILWRLNPTTTGFTFPAKGIDFKPTSPAPPANEFNCRPVAHGNLYFCSNRNTVVRTYTYTVTLKNAAGNTITFDPKIINQ